jgi:excisionase family DNA binding protein
MHTNARSQYLTVRQLAEIWGQDPSTIRRKVHRGLVPSVRLGSTRAAIRIPVDRLEAALPSGRKENPDA